MSLRTSIQALLGVTGFTPIGGSPVTFINDGQGVNGVNVLVDADEGNLLLRRKMTTKLVLPAAAVNANAMAKLGRSSLTVQYPFVDSNGKHYKCANGIDTSYHPEHTPAQRLAMLLNTVSLALDDEMLDFWQKSVNA